eukprot:3287271-Rhodomonas_salina.3
MQLGFANNGLKPNPALVLAPQPQAECARPASHGVHHGHDGGKFNLKLHGPGVICLCQCQCVARVRPRRPRSPPQIQHNQAQPE